MISFGTNAYAVAAIDELHLNFKPDSYSFHTFRASGAEAILEWQMNTSTQSSATEVILQDCITQLFAN